MCMLLSFGCVVLIVVWLPRHVWLFVTPWTAACQASLSHTISQNVPKFMSIESLMPSNHLIISHRLLLLPSIFPRIRVFSRESAFHIKWPKYWGFSFSISHSSESISIQSWFPLGLTGLISLMSKETSKIFSSTTIRQHQFFSTFTLLSSSHISTWQPERPWLWLWGPLLTKWCLCFLIYCLGLSLHSFQEAVVF